VNAGITSTTAAVMASGVAFGSLGSMLGNSAPQSCLNSVNTVQLLLLLPMFEVFLPQAVFSFIQSMNFSLIDFGFIPFLDYTSDNDYISVFASTQEDSYLYLIGLESGSCIPNLVLMAVMSLLIPFAHLLLAPFY